MDIKEKLYPPREAKVLIVDDTPKTPVDFAAAAAFVKAPDLELKPNEKWPDGKVRPHRVKTNDGEIVHLTDEEFDELVMAARRRYYANPQGPRSLPKPDIRAGDLVGIVCRPSADTELVLRGHVDAVKTDGRLRLRLEETLPIGTKITVVLHPTPVDPRYQLHVTEYAGEYVATSSEKGVSRLRLLLPGENVPAYPQPEPAAPAAPETKGPSIGEIVREAIAPHNRAAAKERKARKKAALEARRAGNRELNAQLQRAKAERYERAHAEAIEEDGRRNMQAIVTAAAAKTFNPGMLGAVLK